MSFYVRRKVSCNLVPRLASDAGDTTPLQSTMNHHKSTTGRLRVQSRYLSCSPTNSVKAFKETQSIDPIHWCDLIFLSFTSELLKEGSLLPAHQLSNSTSLWYVDFVYVITVVFVVGDARDFPCQWFPSSTPLTRNFHPSQGRLLSPPLV